MAVNALCFQSISQLSTMLAHGDVSPVELTQTYLDRIHTVDTSQTGDAQDDGARGLLRAASLTIFGWLITMPYTPVHRRCTVDSELVWGQ
jgi:hypothetical protein